MLFYVLLSTCVLVAVIHVWLARKSKVPGAPSPGANPIFGHMFKFGSQQFHQQMTTWSEQCGPIFRLEFGVFKRDTVLIVNDFDSIYEVLVTNGKAYGGRTLKKRIHVIFEHTGILFSTNPDKTWQSLRKASHQHLRQFGDGMARLEDIINEVSDDMFKAFDESHGKPMDPQRLIFEAALGTIAFLITGDRLHNGHPIIEKMRFMEKRGPDFMVSRTFKYRLFDWFPVLRHLPLGFFEEAEEVLRTEKQLWQDILKHASDNPHLDSFVSTLLSHVKTADNQDGVFSEKDAQKTAFSLLFAGVATTSATFYATVNILAHYPDIQERISQEIDSVAASSTVSLKHRSSLPYTQAFLLEILRYTSVVSTGVFHRAVQDVTLKGLHILNGTIVGANLWAMHHDGLFWKEPFEFQPGRFLDEDGELLTADHPNRRHLMPFGAGTRVCVGESLALARLFLWISTLVQKFRVKPASANSKTSTDPRNFQYEGVLRVTPYEVLFEHR